MNGCRLASWLGSVCVALACASAWADVQISIMGPDGELIEEYFVVVGSRAEARSATDSIVPVDAVTGDALTYHAGSDMTNLVRSLVPAFHVSTNPSRDAAALQRPINLRGLAPDHTLVLVNKKRRHRGAVIQWISNGSSDGAQGPDISSIPSIAIDRVEVLRDGAAAQYGSDAIAGVLNFVLKEGSGGSLDLKYGVHTEDTAEDTMTLAANYGFDVGASGFLNLSAEYAESAATDRSVQHPSAAAVAAAGVANVANPAKPWGEPDVRDSVKLFANFGADVGDAAQIYAFGNHASREVVTPFFYRPPQGRTGVYVGGGNLLIGGGADCKAKYGWEAIAKNVPMVRDMLADDPDCFSFHEILPAGFTPMFGGQVADASAVAGWRGDLANGLSYDFSASWGRNAVDFFLHDTVNASHGPNTQRDFDIGEYGQTETSFNAAISYPANVGLASPLNIAAGLERREEEFEVTTGEPNSWNTGPYAADGFSARSNGFGGFNPASSGAWARANVAAYIDMEVDATERWRVSGALRWEDFDDFGAVSNFKLATMLRFTDSFAMRGSYGTGFRAPTPGQQNANNLATVVDSATGEFREQGTIASTNPVALALGGRALDAETSGNYTMGFVYQTPGRFALTVDWFRITVEDRIALSSTTDVTAELRDTLLAAGVSEAADFNNVRYFANDFDTETQGFDAVLTYGFGSRNGDTSLLFGYNRATTSVEAFDQASTASRRRALEEGVPESRISVSAVHARSRWDLIARYNYFGEWYDSDDNHVHSGYGLLDVAAQVALTDSMSLAVGADNILDTYPDMAVRSPSSGRLYPRYSPSGYAGRVAYLRLGILF